MTDPSAYLALAEERLLASPVIAQYQMLQARATPLNTYIRLRAVLRNGDFLEAAEYCKLVGPTLTLTSYRYQWMNADKTQLRRRWDCAPDHPELANFPHHIHEGDEATVRPGEPLALSALLLILEAEVA